MKVISIAAAGVSLAFIALTLFPGAGEYRASFAAVALIGSVVALATIVAGWRERASVTSVRQETARNATHVPTVDTAARRAANVAVAAAPAVSREAEIVGFLATLQEKGRLVDFLQDDITGFSDAQVGAAARIVHQGCKTVLAEYFAIVPVREENEGAKVAVPAGYAADEYRLVGKIGGHAPFSGTLMHRGWKAESVRLPRVFRTDDQRLPTIAPAEVELR